MKHCCEMMETQINHKCDQHEDPFDCPDNLIYYSVKFDEYGIIIHNGGSSFSHIQYCPYCGSKLPYSKRDLWFDLLEGLGFDTPFEQGIPEEFTSDRWYKDREIKKPDKTIVREYIELTIREVAIKYSLIEPPSFTIGNSVDNMEKVIIDKGNRYSGVIKLYPNLQDYYTEPESGFLSIVYTYDENKVFTID